MGRPLGPRCHVDLSEFVSLGLLDTMANRHARGGCGQCLHPDVPYQRDRFFNKHLTGLVESILLLLTPAPARRQPHVVAGNFSCLLCTTCFRSLFRANSTTIAYHELRSRVAKRTK